MKTRMRKSPGKRKTWNREMRMVVRMRPRGSPGKRKTWNREMPRMKIGMMKNPGM